MYLIHVLEYAFIPVKRDALLYRSIDFIKLCAQQQVFTICACCHTGHLFQVPHFTLNRHPHHLTCLFPHDRLLGCLQLPTHNVTMNICIHTHFWTLSRNVLECTSPRILNSSEFCPAASQEVCTSLVSGHRLLASRHHPPFSTYSFKKTCKKVERKICFLVNPRFPKIPPKHVLPVLLRF